MDYQISNQYLKELLKKAYLEIENKYPDDRNTLEYKDYLKIRNEIPYYQFNPNFFFALVQLLCQEWNSTSRINRISMLQMIQLYQNKCDKNRNEKESKVKKDTLLYKTNRLLFKIFTLVHVQKQFLPENQIEKGQKLANHIIKKQDLVNEEIEWLVEHPFLSEHTLNRIIGYHYPSPIISEWILKEFNNDKLRLRRNEIIGWVLDLNPQFEVDHATLLADFQYMNKIDLERIHQFQKELENSRYYAYSNTEQQFDITLYNKTTNHLKPPFSLLPVNKGIQLTRKYIDYRFFQSSEFNFPIPDFYSIEEEFEININYYHSLSMIWGVAYSHLDQTTKTQLLIKYYHDYNIATLIKICKKNKNKEMINFILQDIEKSDIESLRNDYLEQNDPYNIDFELPY